MRTIAPDGTGAMRTTEVTETDGRLPPLSEIAHRSGETGHPIDEIARGIPQSMSVAIIVQIWSLYAANDRTFTSESNWPWQKTTPACDWIWDLLPYDNMLFLWANVLPQCLLSFVYDFAPALPLFPLAVMYRLTTCTQCFYERAVQSFYEYDD